MTEEFIATTIINPAPHALVLGGGEPTRTYLTITNDGRIEIGPGLSMDEATQKAAMLLAQYFEKYVRV